MALRTLNAPIINIGNTADRPTAPPGDGLFIDEQLNLVQIFSGGSWRGGNPTFSGVATVTALKALAATSRYNNLIVKVDADQSLWYFHSTSVLTGDNILVATPDAGSGRWLRLPGAVDLVMPIVFGTADAAVLLTLPTGSRFLFDNAWWNIATQFAGGTNASIGLSSSATGFSTEGDLIGATLTAALTAGIRPGVIGTGVDTVAKRKTAIFVAGDTIRHDRVVDAFTSGAGDVHLTGTLLLNPGA
jgi:hypothetical protein